MANQADADDGDVGDDDVVRTSSRVYPESLPPNVARPRATEDDNAVNGSGVRKAARDTYAERLIEHKHREYTRLATAFKVVYYLTRSLSVGATATIPFSLNRAPTLAFVCSIVACAANVIDIIVGPAQRYRRFARATHLLAVFKMKRERTYPSHKEALDVLIATEEGDLAQFTDLSAMLKKLEENNK